MQQLVAAEEERLVLREGEAQRLVRVRVRVRVRANPNPNPATAGGAMVRAPCSVAPYGGK